MSLMKWDQVGQLLAVFFRLCFFYSPFLGMLCSVGSSRVVEIPCPTSLISLFPIGYIYLTKLDFFMFFTLIFDDNFFLINFIKPCSR